MIEWAARRAHRGASRSVRVCVLALLAATVLCALGLSDVELAAVDGAPAPAVVSVDDAQYDEHGPTCREAGPDHHQDATARAERPFPGPSELLVDEVADASTGDSTVLAGGAVTRPACPATGRQHLIEAQISRT